ncbi:MAG TPA: hypothetical protein VFR81_25675 [Longimicrobium sp.]|nr:hypothetical protein [Longimicrobium sp.]
MLGIMNDIVASMPYHSHETLEELEMRLADTPYSQPKQPLYLFPRAATAILADQPHLANPHRAPAERQDE